MAREVTRRLAGRLWMMALGAAACGRSGRGAAPKNSQIAAADSAPTILLIGTSLTAGYGLDPDQAWSALIQRRIDSAAWHFRIINAGVSGETSADTRHRLTWLLSQGTPAVIMLETGANDGLRGESIDSLRVNIDSILTRLDRLVPRPAVILADMETLPNMGRDYGDRFRAVYPELARAHHAYELPFLLNGVAGVDSLNQGDRLHPNAEGSRIVAENVWRILAPILDSIRKNEQRKE